MDKENGALKLSLDVVAPVYNEQETLPELARRLKRTLSAMPDISWRVLFVNDGSKDTSLEMLRDLHAADKRFCIVELSRNFGHQAALSAGLSCVDADVVVLMDSDLQDPPEVIPALLVSHLDGNEVVLAERKSRQERGLRRFGFDLFHRLFHWISDLPIRGNSGTFCLMGREAAFALAELREKNRYIPGLRAWIGFSQGVVQYDRAERFAGSPQQTLQHLWRYAFDAIFSFSYKPLRLIMLIGSAACAAGLGLALLFVIKRLMGIETAQTGFTTLITCLLFFGGAQLVGLGILGEYLARVYDEVKNRPLYLIQDQKISTHQSQASEIQQKEVEQTI